MHPRSWVLAERVAKHSARVRIRNQKRSDSLNGNLWRRGSRWMHPRSWVLAERVAKHSARVRIRTQKRKDSLNGSLWRRGSRWMHPRSWVLAERVAKHSARVRIRTQKRSDSLNGNLWRRGSRWMHPRSWVLAERVGFEPTKPCGLPAFQAGALGRTALPLHLRSSADIIPFQEKTGEIFHVDTSFFNIPL